MLQTTPFSEHLKSFDFRDMFQKEKKQFLEQVNNNKWTYIKFKRDYFRFDLSSNVEIPGKLFFKK